MPTENENVPVLELKIPKSIREKITAPIPAGLIKQRDGGGGKKLSYISGSSVTDQLNAAFGYMWNWQALTQWVQESEPFFNSYSKLPDAQKEDYNGKRGAWEKQAPVAHVHGRLTVFFKDGSGTDRTIMKEGFGSKSILGKQNDQESVFKAAGTDALKKAASLLGIGLELYRDEDEQAHFDAMAYEDPWPEHMIEKYAAERNFLSTMMDEYSLSVEDMEMYVSEFSEGSLTALGDIVPDNIGAFVDFLKEGIAEAEKNAQEEEKAKAASAAPKSPLSAK